MNDRQRMMLFAFGFVLLPQVAEADAIDGDWCLADGRHMAIAGPRILTPGGARLTGNYDRHAFSYTVPAAEPGGGSTISMVLLDEDTLRLHAERPIRKDEIWRRCAAPTS